MNVVAVVGFGDLPVFVFRVAVFLLGLGLGCSFCSLQGFMVLGLWGYGYRAGLVVLRVWYFGH